MNTISEKSLKKIFKIKKMRKEIIKDKNKLIATVLRNGDYPKGLAFFNDDNDFIQVGTWNYDKGKLVKDHRHKVFSRQARRTQEVIMVKSGKMKVKIFTDKDKLIKNIILKKGDVIIQLNGGHGFEILENNTQIFEVKNGPFMGVEKDKKIL